MKAGNNIEDPITIPYTSIAHETDRAFLLNCEGDEVWLPRGEINLDLKGSKVTMPEWLFKEKFPNG